MLKLVSYKDKSISLQRKRKLAENGVRTGKLYICQTIIWCGLSSDLADHLYFDSAISIEKAVAHRKGESIL